MMRFLQGVFGVFMPVASFGTPWHLSFFLIWEGQEKKRGVSV
jgi:hypothetical protein